MTDIPKLLGGTPPHQDKRVEDAIAGGLTAAAKLAEAEGAPDAVVMIARLAARAGILHAIAALGIDTSAHVHAPHVDVRVHRPAPPHDVDDV